MHFRSVVAGLAVGLGAGVFAGAASAQTPAGWGTVKGQFTLPAGMTVPERKELTVTKDHGHCLSKGKILSDVWLVDPKTRGVKNVFVWLAPLQSDGQLPVNPALQAIPESQKNVEMDQPCCMFIPHCVALREGQNLVVKNSAPVVHNFHWTGTNNAGGNVSVQAGQQHVIKGLVADRTPIKVVCDFHPWMSAWIGVFNHPYFALSDENGNYEIKGAPAGQYRIIAWHEDMGWVFIEPGQKTGKNGKPITIKADAVTDGSGTVAPAKP
jgi:hypothetical protein